MNERPQQDPKRFIVAMAISGAILIVWQLYFAPTPPPPQDETELVAEKSDEKENSVQRSMDPVPDTPPPVIEAYDPEPVEVRIFPREVHVLETPHFRVTFDSKGAHIKSVEYKLPEQYTAEGNLLKDFPEDSAHFPFQLTFQRSVNIPRDAIWEIVDRDQRSIDFRYQHARGLWTVEKRFETTPDKPYELAMSASITNSSGETIEDAFSVEVFGYKDPDQKQFFFDFRPDELEAICHLEGGKTERTPHQSVDGTRTYDEREVLWGGVGKRYFLLAAVPEGRARKCRFERDDMLLISRVTQENFTISHGDVATQKWQLYVGPKDYDVLRQSGDDGLHEAVDFGFFTVLAKPLRFLLVLFYNWVHNWGLAIILLTLLIRGLTWPINQKVYENGERMKEIQPRMTELREKYKNDQQRMTEETMKLMKENNVSMMGCLPMLIQIPILFALYIMILNSVELYQANFILWYTDLSAPDPYFVLPIAMGIAMFFQQKLMASEAPNPQMQIVMKVMPVMMVVFMLFLPAGVVLYYSISLILGLAQQFYIRRKYKNKKAAA